MYIEPNSTIYLLKNVPLDSTYNNTVLFPNATAQANAFITGHSPKRFERVSYQRVERNRIRLGVKSDEVFNYNYMMFMNTSYNTKWFYAFINDVRYINDNTCEIDYTLDVLQTWLFDVELLESFVEREHTTTDVAGDNIVDEGIPVGEYYYDDPVSSSYFDDYGYVMVAPLVITDLADPTNGVEQNYSVQRISGVLSGVRHTYFASAPDMAGVLALINLNANLAETILEIYIVPSAFVGHPEGESGRGGRLPEDMVTKRFPSETVSIGKPLTLGTYTPKNKKLLTYPFSKCIIDTFEGSKAEYAYEFFDEQNIHFTIYANLNSNCGFRCVPVNYKGNEEYFQNAPTLSNFPMMAYTTDSYRAWLAQNKGRMLLTNEASILSASVATAKIGAEVSSALGLGAVGSGAGALTGTALSGAEALGIGLSAVNPVSLVAVGASLYPILKNAVAGATAQKTMGGNVHGSTDGSLEIAMHKKGFHYIHAYANESEARRIDDYFSMFGYAVNEIKVPNRSARPHWTYTKTVHCNLRGNAPASDLAMITALYDRGITFWKSLNEVGDYSLDNSPA